MSTLLDSYQTYFRDVYPILKDMSRRGIPIDESRRAELKELIDREDIRVTAAIQAIVPAEVLSTKQKNGYKNPPILNCEDCEYKGRGDHICTEGTVVSYSDLAEMHGLMKREVILTEEEKCRCTVKTRSVCDVCMGSGLIPAGVVECRWASPVQFNPNSPTQVRRFIRFLGHPVPKHAKRTDAQGEASDTTEMKELERLWVKTKHPIYPLLIEKRQLTKVEGTYYEGWKPSKDSCVHTTYTFGTATWQTSSKAPNVQNGLKHADEKKAPFKYALAQGFLRMQRAMEGRVLMNFDFKSFHALTTAHDFNIPDYARLARIDIHSFVTCHYLRLPERVGLFNRPDEEMLELFKSMRKTEPFGFTRDFKAKRTILGIQFGMGYRKLYQLNRDDFENESEARTLHDMVYGLFPRLRIAQNEVKARAAEDKRLVNKYGAIRHFYDVQRWDRRMQKMVPGDQAEQAVAFLPASHAFGHFRSALLRLRAGGWDERFGLCNQIHDSMLFHCDRRLAEECISVVKPLMEEPSTVLIYPQMAPNGLSVGADLAMGDCLAECK